MYKCTLCHERFTNTRRRGAHEKKCPVKKRRREPTDDGHHGGGGYGSDGGDADGLQAVPPLVPPLVPPFVFEEAAEADSELEDEGGVLPAVPPPHAPNMRAPLTAESEHRINNQPHGAADTEVEGRVVPRTQSIMARTSQLLVLADRFRKLPGDSKDIANLINALRRTVIEKGGPIAGKLKLFFTSSWASSYLRASQPVDTFFVSDGISAEDLRLDALQRKHHFSDAALADICREVQIIQARTLLATGTVGEHLPKLMTTRSSTASTVRRKAKQNFDTVVSFALPTACLLKITVSKCSTGV